MRRDGQVSRRGLLAAAWLAPASRLLYGQQVPTFSADVKVVNVLATVRDKKGQIVRDLTRSEFLLDEDGRPQSIKYFSQESDLPLTLGLLVDVSPSQRRVLDDERSASYKFFDQVLREDKDVAFIIHFDADVELLQDITSSRQRLERALGSVGGNGTAQRPQWGQRDPGPADGSGGPGSGQRGRGGRGGTALYDATLLASDEIMRKRTGRKALIILTDGVDTASKVRLEGGVEAAQRADSLVYSVWFADPDAYGGGFGGMGGGRGRSTADGWRALQTISKETGGHVYEVTGKQTIAQVYQAIEEDLRHQYSIGYTSDRADGRGYRRIHLSATQKGLVVTAREGYYPS
jgi:VWFA-related protein